MKIPIVEVSPSMINDPNWMLWKRENDESSTYYLKGFEGIKAKRLDLFLAEMDEPLWWAYRIAVLSEDNRRKKERMIRKSKDEKEDYERIMNRHKDAMYERETGKKRMKDED